MQRKLLAEANLMLKHTGKSSKEMEAAHHQVSELQAVKALQDIYPVNVLKQPCICCYKTNHAQVECYFRSKTCHKCGKVGHSVKVCHGKKNQRVTLEKNTNLCRKKMTLTLAYLRLKQLTVYTLIMML